MSETLKWSFSMDRCVRRCQRQYFLQHVAAWHNARDPVRREAFLLKQVKTLDLWQGSLVHRDIELFVVPALQDRRSEAGIRFGGYVRDVAVVLARPGPVHATEHRLETLRRVPPLDCGRSGRGGRPIRRR